MDHTTDQGVRGIYCQNCGRPSHCGVPFMEDYSRIPYNRGIEGHIEVCKSCRCKSCSE